MSDSEVTGTPTTQDSPGAEDTPPGTLGVDLTQPGEATTKGDAAEAVPQMEPLDDPYGSLRTFLVSLNPDLGEEDFHPADLAMEILTHQREGIVELQGELTTEQEYLAQFIAKVDELTITVESLKGRLAVASQQAAQKDVRDERVAAIRGILGAKMADSAKVGRIQRLLE